MSNELQGKLFYFDDFIVGDTQQGGSYVMDKNEMIAFAQKWDPQPWHVDEVLAKASMYGGLTACSSHIFAIFCMVCQRWKSGGVSQSMAGLGFDELEVHQPVYVADTLESVTIVDSVRASKTKPDRGIVVSKGQLVNQHDEIIFSVKSKYMVARDPAKY